MTEDIKLELDWDRMIEFPVAARADAGEGVVCEVRWEEYVEEYANPRQDRTNLGHMVCAHRGYDLGDEQVQSAYTDVPCEACDEDGHLAGRWIVTDSGGRTIALMLDEEHEDGDASDAAAKLARRHGAPWAYNEQDCEACEAQGTREVTHDEAARLAGARVVLPVYLYDHGQLRMKVGSFAGLLPEGHAEFDSGMVGIIHDTPETRAECFGDTEVSDEEIERQLRDEVEEYDAYLRGDVFYYRYGLADEDGELGSDYEACGGYLGDPEYAMQEAEWEARSLVQERREIRERNELTARSWRY